MVKKMYIQVKIKNTYLIYDSLLTNFSTTYSTSHTRSLYVATAKIYRNNTKTKVLKHSAWHLVIFN